MFNPWFRTLPQNPTTIDLAKYEVFNAILVLSRRGLLREDEVSKIISYAERILGRIKMLGVNIRELREIYEAARQHGLTVYDAAYLYTAKKLGGVLVTEDKELLSRSKQVGGVSVFIIICSAHVHWFLRPFNAMRYADAYKLGDIFNW